MVNDGICQNECNTYQCGFNDCTTVEAQSYCAQMMMADGTLLQTSPANPIVDATVRIEPHEIEINDVESSSTMKATYMIRYADPRLFALTTNPCMKVLEHIVSISASEAADRSKLLQKLQDADSLVLLPVLQASNKMMDMVITERSFRLIEKNHTKLNVTLRNGGIAMDVAWTRLLDTKLDTLDPVIGQNLSQIDVASSYAELSYTATIKVHQPHFDYLLYPFDAQIVKLHFEPGVNITSCGTGVFLDDAEHPLVSGSYIFGTPRVSSMHSSVRTADGGCTIEIPVSRIFSSYLIKDFTPGVLIVLAGLCGMFLDPTNPPLLGSRTALMIFSMMLSFELSQATHLRMPSIMWTDLLMVVQLTILVTALLETMVVHQLVRQNKTVTALALDNVLRWCLPAMYVVSVAFLVCWASTSDPLVSSLIIIVGFLCLFGFGYKTFRDKLKYFKDLQAKRRQKRFESRSRSGNKPGKAIKRGSVNDVQDEAAALQREVDELRFDDDHSFSGLQSVELAPEDIQFQEPAKSSRSGGWSYRAFAPMYSNRRKSEAISTSTDSQAGKRPGGTPSVLETAKSKSPRSPGSPRNDGSPPVAV